MLLSVDRKHRFLLDALEIPAGRTADMPGFKRMKVTADGVWLVPSTDDIAGVLIPLAADEPATVLWRGATEPPPWDSDLRDGVATLRDRFS